jgi:FkbM family methyltransferase
MKAIFYPEGRFGATYIPQIYSEIYIEKVYNEALHRKRNLTIVDVGANIGITVQNFAGHAKQLYAIEPAKDNYEVLVKNIEFNGWNNVKPIKAAIAEKDGEMELSLNPLNTTTHSLFLKHTNHKSEKVRTITFETLFKENNIEKADFVKLDIEGYETMVLLGEDFKKMSSKINMIEVEFHGQDLTKIIERMTSLGFKNKQIKSSAVIYLFYK